MPVRPARAQSRALKTTAARPRRQDAALVALYLNNNASDEDLAAEEEPADDMGDPLDDPALMAPQPMEGEMAPMAPGPASMEPLLMPYFQALTAYYDSYWQYYNTYYTNYIRMMPVPGAPQLGAFPQLPAPQQQQLMPMSTPMSSLPGSPRGSF